MVPRLGALRDDRPRRARQPLDLRRGLRRALAGGQRAYKARVIARHVALIREHFGEKYALVQMKKHLAWYTEGLGHATACRARIFQTRSPDEVWEVFQSYWDRPRPEISQTASTLSARIA